MHPPRTQLKPSLKQPPIAPPAAPSSFEDPAAAVCVARNRKKYQGVQAEVISQPPGAAACCICYSRALPAAAGFSDSPQLRPGWDAHLRNARRPAHPSGDRLSEWKLTNQGLSTFLGWSAAPVSRYSIYLHSHAVTHTEESAANCKACDTDNGELHNAMVHAMWAGNSERCGSQTRQQPGGLGSNAVVGATG